MHSVSMVAAFTAGLISFLSPCVLPLVPGYISMISGASVDQMKSGDDNRMLGRILTHSLLFILGLGVVALLAAAGLSPARAQE